MDRAVYETAYNLMPAKLAKELEDLLANTSVADLHAVVQSSFRDRCLLRIAQWRSIEKAVDIYERAFFIAATEDYYLDGDMEAPSVGAIILLLDILPFSDVQSVSNDIHNLTKTQKKMFNSNSSSQRTKLLYRCVDHVSSLVLTKEITEQSYREFRNMVDRSNLFKDSFINVAVKLILDKGIGPTFAKKIATDDEWQQIKDGIDATPGVAEKFAGAKLIVDEESSEDISYEPESETESETIESETIESTEEEEPLAIKKAPKQQPYQTKEADDDIKDAVMNHIKKPTPATFKTLYQLADKNRIVIEYTNESGTENKIFLNKHTIKRIGEIILGKHAQRALADELGEYLQDVFIDKIDTIEIRILTTPTKKSARK